MEGAVYMYCLIWTLCISQVVMYPAEASDTSTKIITSPNYPNLYPGSTTKNYDIWTDTTGSGQSVSVTFRFTFFDIQECRRCTCDRVEIVSGNPLTTRLFCGQVLPNGDGVVTLSHVKDHVSLRFTSDSDGKERSGFYAEYTVIPDPPAPQDVSASITIAKDISTAKSTTGTSSVVTVDTTLQNTGESDFSTANRNIPNMPDITTRDTQAKYHISHRFTESHLPNNTNGENIDNDKNPDANTTTEPPTTTPSCPDVPCPSCDQDSFPTYRHYFENACPSFCECVKTSTDTTTAVNDNVTTTAAPCIVHYANEGYISLPLNNRYYPGHYPLFFECTFRIDLGKDYIFRDKAVQIEFLHFDVDHCKYTYNGVDCRCDYITFLNIRGLSNTRLCDHAKIQMNHTYYLRPESRSDRYVEFHFHSDLFLVKTGFYIHYKVVESNSHTCVNDVCNNTCSSGYWRDFAGCISCDCITTTTSTTTTTTTTRPTTPLLFKSRILQRLSDLVSETQKLHDDVRDSRVLDYAKREL